MLPETLHTSPCCSRGSRRRVSICPIADMNMVNLGSFRNRRNVVLYFYPKDDTPGCTLEAIEFSEKEDDFGALKAVVLGVSMDDCLSHGAFRDKHGLSRAAARRRGRRGLPPLRRAARQGSEGRKKTCIVRSTFIIDRKGVLKHALYGVTPRGHAQEILDC